MTRRWLHRSPSPVLLLLLNQNLWRNYIGTPKYITIQEIQTNGRGRLVLLSWRVVSSSPKVSTSRSPKAGYCYPKYDTLKIGWLAVTRLQDRFTSLSDFMTRYSLHLLLMSFLLLPLRWIVGMRSPARVHLLHLEDTHLRTQLARRHRPWIPIQLTRALKLSFDCQLVSRRSCSSSLPWSIFVHCIGRNFLTCVSYQSQHYRGSVWSA